LGSGRKTRIVVVGGFEAGVETACAFLESDNAAIVHLVDQNREPPGWTSSPVVDPSLSLSDYSICKLQKALETGRLHLHPGWKCVGTASNPYRAFLQTREGSRTVSADLPVVVCNGFDPSRCKLFLSLFDWDGQLGGPRVSRECDESLLNSGVFLAGPMLRHYACPTDKEKNEVVVFCFVYKFRTRFPLVAGEILSRLVFQDNYDGVSSIDPEGHRRMEALEGMMMAYREKGLMLTDLSCASC